MKGVRQDELDLRQISDIFFVFEHIENHSLDGGLGAHRHKNRGCQGDSVEGDLSNSCISLLFEYLEFKLIHHILTRIKDELAYNFT
jgi:hypothetical protein